MMKIIFSLLFLIPLCYFNYFWMMQVFLIIFTFLFFLNISFSFYSSISLVLGMDLISYFLILLSFWICFLMLMASEKVKKNYNYSELFMFFVLMLLVFLYLTFSILDLFGFYLFFESTLIPTMIIILGWGYQPERIQAGLYLFFYTMLASLPMMLFLFYYYLNFYSLSYILLNQNLNSVVLYLMMNMVFFVKIPMFVVHLWLPKAHVEAPVSGSMILAGVMLKLGGYGLMRFLVLFLELGMKINFIIMNWSLFGAVVVSLICLRQSDSKSLIAYSSVVHMGLMLAGLLTLESWGLKGALVMMVAHGLCSSALFILVNFCYERLYSRNLFILKGMINLFPSLSLWWFLFSIANMAAPPSLNLLGEIMLINSLVSFSSLNMIFLMLISFFSGAYSLYLYAFTQHGKGSFMFSLINLNFREFLLMLMHWLPLNLLILKSELFNF
uniref:NADH-ubiquinone oxidoreductase chain 4 n=1 Tax=Thalassa montezumae TaxID=3129753 RepID=A0AAU7LK37_9CUCU